MLKCALWDIEEYSLLLSLVMPIYKNWWRHFWWMVGSRFELLSRKCGLAADDVIYAPLGIVFFFLIKSKDYFIYYKLKYYISHHKSIQIGGFKNHRIHLTSFALYVLEADTAFPYEVSPLLMLELSL